MVVPSLGVSQVVVSVCMVIFRVVHMGVLVLRISVAPVAVLHDMLLVHCWANVILIS